MKSSFCIDLQRFMLIPTKFPLSPYPPTICKDYSELLLSNDDLCSTWCCGGRRPPLLFYQLSHGGINTKKGVTLI